MITNQEIYYLQSLEVQQSQKKIKYKICTNDTQ